MRKTLVGPRLRQLRRERKQTQAEMAEALGISPAYVNLLENNQRALSVQVLMALTDAYNVDWRDLIKDDGATRLSDLRHVLQDPIFEDQTPDLQEIRGALDHAPALVQAFLTLYGAHRTMIERVMRSGDEGGMANLTSSTPETAIHDFFRNNSNHFEALETAAERLEAERPSRNDDLYTTLKTRLQEDQGFTVRTATLEEMPHILRDYDAKAGTVYLSEALDHQNRKFQLAHVLCLVTCGDLLDQMIEQSNLTEAPSRARCRVELANYFAAAYLMPYAPFYTMAEKTNYDIDRLAAAFDVSFEQVCQRLTTLQREGQKGVPFFFLRVDKAGNVTKRFNATSFHLAEHGGSCPVWNVHAAFRTPGLILPQFLDLPDGQRFFSISRTTERPVFSRETQDRRLAVALGCEMQHVHRVGYASSYNLKDEGLFSPIGINCHLCPRQACSQRAHQPLHMNLPIDANRRGNTRYES